MARRAHAGHRLRGRLRLSQPWPTGRWDLAKATSRRICTTLPCPATSASAKPSGGNSIASSISIRGRWSSGKVDLSRSAMRAAMLGLVASHRWRNAINRCSTSSCGPALVWMSTASALDSMLRWSCSMSSMYILQAARERRLALALGMGTSADVVGDSIAGLSSEVVAACDGGGASGGDAVRVAA